MNHRTSLSKSAFAWLVKAAFLFLACFSSVTWAADTRRVMLVAHITVKNSGSVAISPYYQRITVPVSDHPQQKLVKILDPENSPAGVLKKHKNGIDDYLEYRWDIPARTTLSRDVGFVLDLASFDEKSVRARTMESRGGQTYLEPSEGVESDAPAIRSLADGLKEGHVGKRERVQAAYEYVWRNLRVRDMKDNRGALYALQTGGGDCTEFNSLFVALSRAMGIPARMTAEFLFGEKGDDDFSQPNHHAAEVYLLGRWLPVDANLAVDRSFGYGFGHGGTRKVVLRREGAWVWGYWTPSKAKSSLDVRVKWSLRDMAPGG